MNEVGHRGLELPERVRQSIAATTTRSGVQARVISTQARDSLRPPQAHLIVAGTREEIESIRGRVRIVRQLEFYKTFHGPVLRLAFSVYPESGGHPLSAGTLLNISQVSGDTALSSLGRQKSIFIHFYHVEGGDLTYAFSKEIPNAPEQRNEAKKVLKMARQAYAETPEERRSFRSAVALAERQFELPLPLPDE